MQYLVAALVIAVIIIFRQSSTKAKKSSENPPIEVNEKENLPIKGAYQKKWLFSYNEKDAYKALKKLCDTHGLNLMSKVRLIDLVEPIKGNPKYKTYFWKVQAKHVDFVICDEKLVARCIIELDDSSHKQESRKERDIFVDEVLQSVGYEIFHVQSIIPEEIEPKIKSTFKIETLANHG